MRLTIYIALLFGLLANAQIKHKGLPVYYLGQPVYSSGGFYVPPEPTCEDGIQNGDETGVDCGGSCAPCSEEFVATVSAPDATANESDLSIGYFQVCLDAVNNTGSGITVNYTTSGTGVGGTNYVALSGTVTIPDGSQCVTINVTPLNDVNSVNETVILTLASGTGYTVGSPNNALVTIVDDDGSGGSLLASVTALDATGTEESETVVQFHFTLNAVNDTGSDVVINYHLDGLANVSDYTGGAGTIAIANGQSAATLTLTMEDDGLIEPDETILAVIDPGDGYTTEGLDRAMAEIIDNDDISPDYPTTSGTSTIANATDFENPANAGTLATVTGSFSVTGLTPATGMVIKAGGGILSGTLNVGTIGIENSNAQLFASNIVFSAVYTKSRLSIEMFGATSGDATDDHTAMQTAINWCQHLTARSSGTYVKNDHSTFTRDGYVDWDLNGSKVSTTSASNFATGPTDFSKDELLRFDGLDPYIYNGTFDMTDTYGRLFRILNYTSFSFKDLVMENLWNPQPIRSYAIRGGGAANLTFGDFVRNTFREITAEGDNSANNSDGISKGIWMECGTISDADFEIVHYGNTYHHITGDDAEAVYYTASGDRFHDGHTLFDNETYYEIGRRAIKMTKGQFTIQNSDFTEISNALFESASLTANMIDVFSTSGVDLQNIKVVNNQIRTAPGESIKRWLNSYTDSQDILVKGNTYTVSVPDGLGAIRLGSNTSTYDGTIRSMVIKENIFINSCIEWMQYYDGDSGSPTKVHNNSFTYTSVSGPGMAPLDFYHTGSDLKGFVDFEFNDIAYEVSPGGYDGIISSDGAGVTVTDVLINSNNIAFESGSATYEVGNIAGAMTNSTVIDNIFTGASGNVDLNIAGAQTGTTGSGNTPPININ